MPPKYEFDRVCRFKRGHNDGVLAPFALLGLAFLIVACGASRPPSHQSPRSSEIACTDLITPAQIADFNSSTLPENLAGVVGQSPQPCQAPNHNFQPPSEFSHDEKSYGYTSILAIPAFGLSPNIEVSGGTLKLMAHFQPISADLIKNIEQRLTTATGQNVQVTSAPPEIWQSAKFDDLPTVDFNLFETTNDGAASQHAIVFLPPPRLYERFRKALETFAAGSGKLRLATRIGRAEGLLALVEIEAGEPARLRRFQLVRASDRLTEEWREIRDFAERIDKVPELPFQWMQKINIFFSALGVSPQEAAKIWEPALDLAKALWLPSNEKTQAASVTYLGDLEPKQMASSLRLKALRFAGSLDPEGEIKRLFQLQLLTDEFFGEQSDRQLAEIEILNAIGGDREALFVETAKIMQRTRPDPESWISAREIATNAAFDRSKIALITEADRWILSVTQRQDLNSAQEWVLRFGLTSERLRRAQDLQFFLSTQTGRLEAFQLAVSAAIHRGLTQIQFILYKKAVRWLRLITNSSTALSRTEWYIFSLGLDENKFKILVSSFERYSKETNSDEALRRAEHDAFTTRSDDSGRRHDALHEN